MFVKMLTDMHMMVFNWWCWHICKGKSVGVDVDQLWEAKKKGFSVFSGNEVVSWSGILL